jgi:hypothetical protein
VGSIQNELNVFYRNLREITFRLTKISANESRLLIRAVPALIRRCDDLPATITHVPVAVVLVLNTPDDGRLRPKHAE